MMYQSRTLELRYSNHLREDRESLRKCQLDLTRQSREKENCPPQLSSQRRRSPRGAVGGWKITSKQGSNCFIYGQVL